MIIKTNTNVSQKKIGSGLMPPPIFIGKWFMRKAGSFLHFH